MIRQSMLLASCLIVMLLTVGCVRLKLLEVTEREVVREAPATAAKPALPAKPAIAATPARPKIEMVEVAVEHIWGVHDATRPAPPVIAPGAENSLPPSDAVVLFDGTDLSKWEKVGRGEPASWKVTNGYMEAVRGGGDIQSKQKFGDCQLHVEWASPVEVVGESQGRGNSGVFLMATYEVQVLDSYRNKTYPDGQAAALYGQKPPLVNASRGPGEWQTYDIVFRRPIFANGEVVKPATITVFHNGVLVQDHWTIEGETLFQQRARYKEHPDKLPIKLQDHSNPVRYRNIWIRELPEPEKFLK